MFCSSRGPETTATTRGSSGGTPTPLPPSPPARGCSEYGEGLGGGKSLQPLVWGCMVGSCTSLCSGVFSDGNFTYIVEPREMATPQDPPQVSPSSPLRQPCRARPPGFSQWLSLPPPLVTSALLLSSVTPALVPSPCALSSNVPSVPQLTSLWAPVSFAPSLRATPGLNPGI